ncbi:MAG: hypothetical protein ACI3W6_07365 [Clostridia bacterium]
MKLLQTVKAYRALAEMMKSDWDFSFIYPLVHLMREMKTDYEFFCREEMKLVARFGKKEDDGTVSIDEKGCFRFSDEDSRLEYQRCHRALEETEVADKPLISVPRPSNVRGEWLEALIPFCDFRQEETDYESLA